MTDHAGLFGPCSVWLGVHDALSARIARDAHVAGVWVSSYGVSASLKAAPDASVVSAAEMLAVAAQVSRAAGSTGTVVDCDTGYGDAAEFASVVEEYALATTVAALCIEDKRFPKMNTLYANGTEHLEPVETFSAKLRAAAAIRDKHATSLALVARTEALALGAGIEETMFRLRAYARAGADAVLVQSKGPLDELLAVGGLWKAESTLPLICVPTSYPDEPAITWWGNGYDVVVRSHQLLQAAVAAQKSLLADIVGPDTPPAAYAARLTDHDDIARLVLPDT